MVAKRVSLLGLMILATVVVSCGSAQRGPRSGASQSPDPTASPSSQPTPASQSTPKPSPDPKPNPAPPSSQPADSSSPPPAKPQSETQQLAEQISKDVESQGNISRQNSGLIALNRILLAQKAHWLISGRFSTDLSQLDPDLSAETEEYRFEIRTADAQKSVAVAIAKQPKLPSYSGATYAQEAALPLSGLCQTQQASTQPPTAPSLQGNQVICQAQAVGVPQ
ncbi:type IV pilin-like G/H family protein [Lyngbya confervoides]|uniref:Lipoprotein n=1 Tax=Lyngbya confervoides BDU141951 TaxID=1574623 RepID=A0ABD4T1K6_9CYAN|nr:type IV pilin-like G/H family protein [Lyngbya confervoides]MCM1982167.1 hypothetical protein [Lyngbya confervoides BDU141951]